MPTPRESDFLRLMISKERRHVFVHRGSVLAVEDLGKDEESGMALSFVVIEHRAYRVEGDALTIMRRVTEEPEIDDIDF